MAHARKIAVIGLGYVGLPVAVGFARTGASVIGFDIDAGRIADIAAGNDRKKAQCGRGYEKSRWLGESRSTTSC